jgi:hypothetical protein
MAKIFDPTDLDHVVDGTASTEDLEIQTGAKTIEITTLGSITDDDSSGGAQTGVTGKCVYSKLKEVWKTDNDLNKHKFPIQMIYEASFVWINGWGPANQTTRDLIRDAGFQEGDGRENACIISLGSMDASDTDQPYYTQVAGFDQTKSNFVYTGEINENVAIKGSGGTPDYSGYFKAFLREMQKSYASYNLLSEQGLAALKYEAYRLPLANAADLNVIDNDTQIGTTDAGSVSGVKYSELTIDYIVGQLYETAAVGSYVADDVVQDGAGRWYRCTTGGTVDVTDIADLGTMGGAGTALFESFPGERQIGTNYYAFNRILDVQDTTNSYSARLQEIHSWSQYKLREATDINDDVNGDGYGTVYGNVALPFTYFVGSTLHTQPGVFIDNFDNNDKNDMVFWDVTVDESGLDSEDKPLVSTNRVFPYTAAGTLTFSQNFVDEVDNTTRYTMYFQYITNTSLTNLKVTGVTGDNGTLDWSSDAGKLDHLQNNDYVKISGFTTEAGNNGLWQITGAPSSNTVTATKVDGTAPATEGTGEAATVLENPFESPGAIIVDNNSAVDIDAEISAASIGFDFDYTNNNQGGRTPDSDAPVYVVAIAFDGAQYVLASHTITKTTGQNIPINGVDELNYENPA